MDSSLVPVQARVEVQQNVKLPGLAPPQETRRSGRLLGLSLQGVVQESLYQGLVTRAPPRSDLAGAVNVDDRQPDGHALGRDRRASAVLDQQVGKQLLVPGPPLRFLLL